MKIPIDTPAKDLFTLVDDDMSWLNDYKWKLHSMGYAVTYVGSEDITMHRLIMQPKKGLTVDHINGDKLDNRKENLRICTLAQNKLNTPRRSHNKAAYKGIEYMPRLNKYRARIRLDGKRYSLGCFVTPEEAAIAYNTKAKELFGEFAYLNEVKS